MIKIREQDLQKVYEAAKQAKIEEAKQREQRFIDKINKLNQNL